MYDFGGLCLKAVYKIIGPTNIQICAYNFTFFSNCGFRLAQMRYFFHATSFEFQPSLNLK
jgi:hypothetical protein